jgi:predicted transcriptional regulator
MKQESITDEQREKLDKIANTLNVSRSAIVRYAMDKFIRDTESVDRDPFKALFMGEVISK